MHWWMQPCLDFGLKTPTSTFPSLRVSRRQLWPGGELAWIRSSGLSLRRRPKTILGTKSAQGLQD